MATVRAIINTNFGEGPTGEIVEVDDVLWAPYFEGGYLSLLDADGNRVMPITPREAFPVPDPPAA